jgi:hypothetical protein
MNIDWSRDLIIVEGPFDLMKCRSNATCLLGSTLSEMSLLHERILFNSTPIVLALDIDMKDRIIHLADRFISYGIRTKCIFLKKKDPGDMSFSELEDIVAAAHEVDEYDVLRMKLTRSFEMSGSFLK